MFSLHQDEGAPISPVTIAEWAAFALLLVVLAGLWLFISFGWPLSRDSARSSSIPDEVMANLITGNKDAEPVPQIVLDSLTARKKVAGSPAAEPEEEAVPPEVLRLLSPR